jgi:hypothetical protein
MTEQVVEARQACQKDGCPGSWPQSENWSGRCRCDDCIADGDLGFGQPDDGVPAPIIAGTFALYPSPDGGFVLVTDVQGRGVERRAIPAALVRMASGDGMLSKLFGRFGGM